MFLISYVVTAASVILAAVLDIDNLVRSVAFRALTVFWRFALGFVFR